MSTRLLRTHSFLRPLLFGSLFVLAAGANAQPAKAFGAASSNVKKPGLMFGANADEVARALGGAPNATTKDSGWSLNLVLEKPVARELVWAYDLTDPMPLTFNRDGWLLNAPEKRTVRMYYHMGFDAGGKAIAGCMWYHGPVRPLGLEIAHEGLTRQQKIDLPGPGRPGTPPPTRPPGQAKSPDRGENPIPPPTYWNYSLPSIIAQYYDLKEAKFSFWTAPFGRGSEKPAKLHDWRDKIEKGQIAIEEMEIAHEGLTRQQSMLRPRTDGPYGHSGWIMGQGMTADSRWFTVGRFYPAIPASRQTNVGVADVVLHLELARGVEPAYGKIMPTTNDNAIKQPGVK